MKPIHPKNIPDGIQTLGRQIRSGGMQNHPGSQMKEYDTAEEFYIQNAMALLEVETQEEFSSLVGVSRSCINQIRCGDRRVTPSIFLNLLELTGLKPSQLFLELAMPPNYFERKK